MIEREKYLNQKEVAEILGVKDETLNMWRCIKKHSIPYTKIGRVLLKWWQDIVENSMSVVLLAEEKSTVVYHKLLCMRWIFKE